MTSTPPQPQPPSPSLLNNLTTIDTTISSTIYNLTQPLIPYHLLKLLELSGDGRLFFPIIISVLMFPVTTNAAQLLRNIMFNLLIGGVLDLIIIGLTKHLVKRRRPVYNKRMFLTFSVDQYSFPSGHASRVSFIACLVYFYSDLLFGSVSVFVIVWASVTSLSRVLLGRHFVFDVVVGGAIGVANALFVFGYCNYGTLYNQLWDSGKMLVDWHELTHLNLSLFPWVYCAFIVIKNFQGALATQHDYMLLQLTLKFPRCTVANALTLIDGK